ncbi:MAG: hypothetical protein OXN89_21395 [Bryobacterales bacterium]|nr:hypothetical protein [Bryobacterales bacterium]
MTMTRTRLFLAVLLLCGLTWAQAPGSGASVLSDADDVENLDDFGLFMNELRQELLLTVWQVARLRDIQFSLEDETFPLLIESYEKAWEIRRAVRSGEVSESFLDMADAELTGISERIQSIAAMHRQRARAVLASDQLVALDRLERSLASLPAAYEAVHFNLFSLPSYGEDDGEAIIGFPGFGFGSFGPIGGIFGIPGPFGDESRQQLLSLPRLGKSR